MTRQHVMLGSSTSLAYLYLISPSSLSLTPPSVTGRLSGRQRRSVLTVLPGCRVISRLPDTPAT